MDITQLKLPLLTSYLKLAMDFMVSYSASQNGDKILKEQLQTNNSWAEIATKRRVVIYGWYGIPNVGDEAILASIIADLRRLAPQLHITVFSYYPDHTLKHHDVDSALCALPILTREQKVQIRKELTKADLFILGGGGMFHTHSGRHPWLNRLALAKLLGCKTMLYVVGIDPSSTAKARWRLIWRLFSRFADLITVRDEGSQNLLLQAGVRKPITVIPDPVFRLIPSPVHKTKKILQRTLGDFQGPIISFGVGMPPYRFGPIERFKYVEIMAKAGDYVVENFNARVLLVPYDIQPGRDRELCLEVLGMMQSRERGYVLLEEHTPNDILALNDYIDLSICTRFHSLVFAIMSNTPFVSIIYQQKVEELLKEANLKEYGIGIQNLSAEHLIECINCVWIERQSLKQRLSHVALSFSDGASQAPKLAMSLLSNNMLNVI